MTDSRASDLIRVLGASCSIVGLGSIAYYACVYWNTRNSTFYEAQLVRDAVIHLEKLKSERKKDKQYEVTRKSAFSSVKVGDYLLRNSVFKAATYEAMCNDQGVPCQQLAQFHSQMAAGGCSMSIVAYGAVSMAARSFPAQLVCHEAATNELRSVALAIHKQGSLACLQLTHAGYFSDRRLAPGNRIHEQMSPNRLFNPSSFSFSRKMTVADEEKVVIDFVSAARIAMASGFDCVEVHCGHGYLLSQYLSPYLNPNKSLEERLRVPLCVVSEIKKAIGKTLLMVKMNLSDGVPGGMSVEDSCVVACSFASAGADIIALSGGLILENGLYMLRGNVPLRNMIDACSDWLKKLALYFCGPLLIPHINFEEMFFRAPAKCVLESLRQWNESNSPRKVNVCYIGGVHSYSSLATLIEKDGFDFVQSGRAILRRPHIVLQWKCEEEQSFSDQQSTAFACTRCNECIVDATMKQKPISCVEW